MIPNRLRFLGVVVLESCMSLGDTIIKTFRDSQKGLTGLDLLHPEPEEEVEVPKHRMSKGERRKMRKTMKELRKAGHAGEDIYKAKVELEVYVSAATLIAASNRLAAVMGELHSHVRYTHRETAFLRNVMLEKTVLVEER